MKNEFTLAFNEVLEEKQLPKDVILKALEMAMVSAYRRSVNASSAQHVEAKVDPDTGKVQVFVEKEVVEQVLDPNTEVTLAEARRFNPEAALEAMVIVESTPRDFGRVAAQTARQVIQQRIRDAERMMQFEHYQKMLGEIVNGVIQAVNAAGLTIGLDMRAEGSLQRKDMIPGERFHIHDRVRVLIAEVKESTRGPQIILSRTHRDFLRRLLETEVPEIYHGIVEIRSIAREPGERAKVAVSATQSGIDPVGACVGIRGVRIQAIVRELHDEKIDVIEWNADPAQFIAKAISPARVTGVYLNERSSSGKTATVVVPEDQLSLAIGRDGQNARLAAKLTGWRIDIKSVSEAATETLHRLESDATVAAIAINEEKHVEAVKAILAKKAEGRAASPEEYDQLSQFVDRVERRSAQQLQPEKKAAEDARLSALKLTIPKASFSRSILDAGLSDHVAYTLQEFGILSVGDLALHAKDRPDDILRLQGIGPRAMTEINNLVETLGTAPAEEAVVAVAEPAPVVEITPVIEAAVPEAVIEVAPVTVEETAVVPAVEVALPQATPEGEEESSFTELLTLKPEIVAGEEEEPEDEASLDDKKKGKKKKRKSVEVVYDPDKDTTVSTKKHKRGETWEWE